MLLLTIIIFSFALTIESASLDSKIFSRRSIGDVANRKRDFELSRLIVKNPNIDLLSRSLRKRDLSGKNNDTYTHETLPTLWENLESWMTQLPAPIRQVPIIHLAIPGSHNSMTYAIDKNNDLGPDNPALVTAANILFPNLTKVLAYNWAINQKSSVKEQLDGGIRYLDLRLATKRQDDKFYFVHGLYGSEVEQPLREIVDWLDSHPSEIVIMDFQHFYNFTEAHHRALIYTLKNLFKGKLCPRSVPPGSLTLDFANSKRYQVVVVYRHFVVAPDDAFWLDRLWPTPWPETVSRSKLERFLNEGLKNRDRTIGFISQAVLTPDQRYISRHIFENTEQALAKKMQRITVDWVNGHYPGIAGGMNVVMTDFVSATDYLFSKAVIQRNEHFLFDS